jgi:ABC-type nitrate/sulfonate/bicarbonate transport system ATPase subunit
MQQRVGLARALAVKPKVLLMDEPFGSLDEQTKRVMQSFLLDVWEREKTTVVFVTHSIDEAIFLADRVVMMSPRPGRISRIVDVPLPRPRTRDVEVTPEFVGLRAELWAELLDEEDSPPPSGQKQ